MNLPRTLPAFALAVMVLAGCGSARSASPSSGSSPAPVSASAALASPSSSASASAAGVSPAPASSSAAPASLSPASAPASAAALPPLPVKLLIPAIHVDAPVEQVGETPDGAMDVPKKWNDVGWFKLGYRPGQVGNAVIAGHLDSTTDRAVFWNLHKLKAGDKVIVQQRGGSREVFTVVASQAYPYNQAPLRKIFGPTSAPMLNLITCDGAWNRASKNYNQRLVVYTKETGA